MSGLVNSFFSVTSLIHRLSCRLPLVAALLVSGLVGASAQTAPAFNPARANSGTVGIISGGADGTYIRIAADLANVLDSEDLRVLPMIGRGSLQNLRDIMFLRGVDIGIVQMDAREAAAGREPAERCGAAPALHRAPLQRGSPHPRRAATSPISASSTARRSISTRPAAART